MNNSMENDLLITKNPKSAFSESIRAIRTNLSFSAINKELKIVAITSPEPGDGKSFISANLALAYAVDNKKVLVIDADLRKGRQNKIFGLHKQLDKGYTNLILNYESLDGAHMIEYIEPTKYRNLHLIQNGPVPPNPIELLASDNNRKLLAGLKQIYDIIILDCPPVMGLSDTLILSKLSDANVVVVTCKKTSFDDLKDVKRAFEKAGSKITGVIMNKSNKKISTYYRYY